MKDRWTGSGSMSRGTTATSVGSSSRCLCHLRGSGISKQGVLKRAGRLQTSRRYKDTDHAARPTVLSRSIRLQICSKRTSRREFQSWLCVSVGSAIGVFGTCKPTGKWIQAGERRSFSSRGLSVSRGIWYARATKEDGAGGRAVSGGKWCAADEGEERTKKSGRRGRKCIKSQFYYYTRIYRPSECK